jgi:penicillin-binding protein 1A
MTLPKGFQKRRCPALEHGNQGRNEYEASRRAPRQRQSTGGKKHGVGFVIGTILLIFAMTFTMLFGIFMVYVKTTLAPTLNVDASQYTMDLSSILYYQDKTTGKWKELQTLHGTENRIWVDYDKMPKALWQGAVSIEDKRFFKHHGVDWSRTSTAAVNMFLGMRSTYGGSTITQQLLKNLTGDKEGTVKRKVTEIFRALEFEKKYSKQEILEMYLNTIFLGKNCYGVQTAAQYYFGKKVSDLDVAECASLVGITNNPSIYNPLISDKTRANNKKRQEQILKQMYKQGYIDKSTYQSAVSEKLKFTDGSKTAAELVAAAEGKSTSEADQHNSYFVDQVIRDVVSDMQKNLGISEKAAHDRIYHGGYKIYTTVDPDVQDIAESVYENRANLNVTSASGQQLRSGITIVDVSSGNVVAMVGDVGQKNRRHGLELSPPTCSSAARPSSPSPSTPRRWTPGVHHHGLLL